MIRRAAPVTYLEDELEGVYSLTNFASVEG
jgi:hypothetical protein